MERYTNSCLYKRIKKSKRDKYIEAKYFLLFSNFNSLEIDQQQECVINELIF